MPFPEHFQLITGYVQITRRETEEKDDCGNVQRTVVTLNRDWPAKPYDIRAQEDANKIPRVRFLPRASSQISWDIENYNRHASYSSMGAIRPGYTHEMIAARGQVLAETNSRYNYVTNNCNTFANRLYLDLSRS